MTPEQRAWAEGIKAREEGVIENPYEKKDFLLAHEWFHGWCLADTLLTKRVMANVQ